MAAWKFLSGKIGHTCCYKDLATVVHLMLVISAALSEQA